MPALLVDHFEVYAIIRNPLFLLASWNTVPFPIQNGHIPAAESVDYNLKKQLSSIENKVERQLYILNWFFEKYLTYLKRDSIIKYEEIICSKGKVLNVINPAAQELNEQLISNNKLKIYDSEFISIIRKKILLTPGASWNYYNKAELNDLLT